MKTCGISACSNLSLLSNVVFARISKVEQIYRAGTVAFLQTLLSLILLQSTLFFIIKSKCVILFDFHARIILTDKKEVSAYGKTDG
jgi:hypothetical protein